MRERIAPSGFSGLFLDGADSYQYFTEDHPEGRDDMIQLIRTTRDQANAMAGNQLIFVNNAEDLYGSAMFRNMVDGLGTESTWFANDTNLSESNPQQVENVLRLLRQVRRDGKVVLAADYPSRSENVCTFYDRCTTEGFLCLATDYNMTGVVRKFLTVSIYNIDRHQNASLEIINYSTKTIIGEQEKLKKPFDIFNFFRNLRSSNNDAFKLSQSSSVQLLHNSAVQRRVLPKDFFTLAVPDDVSFIHEQLDLLRFDLWRNTTQPTYQPTICLMKFK